MNECKAGYYTSNVVVTHFPLVCFGGFDQPKCKYLLNCMEENGMTKTRSRKLKKLIIELKGEQKYT